MVKCMSERVSVTYASDLQERASSADGAAVGMFPKEIRAMRLRRTSIDNTAFIEERTVNERLIQVD